MGKVSNIIEKMLVKRVVGRPAPLLQASKLQQQLAQKLMASDFLNFHLTPVKHTLFFSWILFADYLKQFFSFRYQITQFVRQMSKQTI